MSNLPEKRGSTTLVAGGAGVAALVAAQAVVNSVVSDIMLAVTVGGLAFVCGYLYRGAKNGK